MKKEGYSREAMSDQNNSGSGRGRMDLAAIRARLASSGGRRYWQSLEELADTPEYRDFLHNEFPHDPANEEGIGRRDVLKYMAASAAFAGLSACTRMPSERIVPYVSAPEEIIPGKPLFYATAMPSPSGGMQSACWWKATWGVLRRSRGTRCIPGAWAQRTPLLRPPC